MQLQIIRERGARHRLSDGMQVAWCGMMSKAALRVKLQHWRGFQGIFGLQGAPMLEFVMPGNQPTAQRRLAQQ